MRRPRHLRHGASYHVINRINRQEMIFKRDDVKEMFMEVLRRAKKKFCFDLKNFCIMGNHTHFIIKPGEGESLSKIMQWILSVFARKFNKTFHLQGHVFYDRFTSKVIESYQQFLHTFIYIALNPVKAGIVAKAVEYRYNGITYLHRGVLDILERPPNMLIKLVWAWVK